MLVWHLEERLALRRRRVFAWNVLVPLVLVAAVALGGAPAAHAAAVYAVLIAFFGTFGSAIPLVRDAERGLLPRVLLTGLSPARFVLERTAAGATLDLLQLVPSLALIAAAAGAGPGVIGWLVLLSLGVLLTLNALGVWVAAAARSIAEAALFGAVLALFVLHASGVFRAPTPGGAAARVEAVLPPAALHDALRSVAAGQGLAAPVELLPACLAGGVLALLGTSLAGPLLLRRLAGH